MKKWIAGIFVTSLLIGGGVQFQNNCDYVVYGNVLSVADQEYIHNQLVTFTLSDMSVANGSGVHGFSFAQGLTVVQKGNRYSYMDINGNLKYPFPFTSASMFDDTRTYPYLSNDAFYASIGIDPNYIYLFKNTYYFRDMYDASQISYLSDLYLSKDDNIIFGDKGLILELEHDGIRWFIDETDIYNDKDIFQIISTGKIIPEPSNYYDIREQAYYYSEGIRAVKWSNGWGFIDKNANITISPQYDDIAGGLSEGLIAVKKNGKWGYINSSNQTVIPFIYDDARGFDNGRALAKKDGYWHIIKHPTEALNQSGISYSSLADFSTSIIKSNITFDSYTYNNFTTPNEHINYLTTQVSTAGNNMNSGAITEINNYITTIINTIEPVEVSIQGSNVYILSSNYNEVLKQSQEVYTNIENILNANNLMTSEIYDKIQPLMQGLGVVSNNGSVVSIPNISNYSVLELPNIEFNFDIYSQFKTKDDFIAYLSQQLNLLPESGANRLDLEEIQKYVDYIFNNTDTLDGKAKKNIVDINYADNKDKIDQNIDLSKSINSVLYNKNIILNKKSENILVITMNGINLDKVITYSFSKDLLEQLEYIDGIRIIISNDYEGFYIKSEDLKSNLEGVDKFEVEILYTDNNIVVGVKDINEEIVYSSKGQFYITTPVENENATIFSTINNVTQNWGGQFNINNNTIEFATNFTGVYEVQNQEIIVNDIGHLTSEQQNKIKFMISKGFFSVDSNGNFNPDGNVQRYHFITSLVRMFYVVDGQATADFSDVLEDNPYYTMVASAKTNSIADGYEDNTFRGETLVTRDEVVAFIARTLAEQKGYSYPNNVENVLSVFTDTQNIYDWSKNDIALAVEHMLVNRIGDFSPKDEITRLEALELLHTLFMKLYEVPTAKTYNETDNNSIFLIASACILLIGLGVANIVLDKRK